MDLAYMRRIVKFKDVHQTAGKNINKAGQDSIYKSCPGKILGRSGWDRDTASNDPPQNNKYLNIGI